jgi:D-alanyl-lipoteichoic acid acyltransferase DltB (MBOAT superfamily)
MQLDSAPYFVFLGIVWLLSRITSGRATIGLLLVSSIVFYAAANPIHGIVVFIVLLGNYAAARALSAEQETGSRNTIFALAVAGNVGLLTFFKLANAIWQPNVALSPRMSSWVLNAGGRVLLPLGISYISFQMIAYLTDLYRKTFSAGTDTGTFFLFGSFFPYISAGPIQRASQVMPLLEEKYRASGNQLATAVSLILFGLFQKFVIANRLALYVHQVYSSDLPLSSIPVALGFILSALQLYADFSGYTDIALGSALLFGVKLAGNFDRPLLAESVTDFWRRWHISLSTWLRDYLYMPLLIRLRDLKTSGIFIAFIVTFLICGAWHKLAWTWVLFGLLHGIALSVEFATRKVRRNWFITSPSLQGLLGRAYTLTFWVLTNALLPAKDLHQAFSMFGRLFSFTLPHNAGEIFAYQGPVLFLLNFVALAVWFMLAKTRQPPRVSMRFALACSVLLVFLGKLPEGNFIYVQF